MFQLSGDNIVQFISLIVYAILISIVLYSRQVRLKKVLSRQPGLKKRPQNQTSNYAHLFLSKNIGGRRIEALSPAFVFQPICSGFLGAKRVFHPGQFSWYAICLQKHPRGNYRCLPELRKIFSAEVLNLVDKSSVSLFVPGAYLEGVCYSW